MCYKKKLLTDFESSSTYSATDNRYLEQFHGTPLSIDTQEQYHLAQVEHVPESLDSFYNGSNCFRVSADLKCNNV